jgi:pentatricopeptide repeat protein
MRRLSTEERSKGAMPWLFPSSWDEVESLHEFRKALRDHTASNQKLFDLYCRLPKSRLPYLDRGSMETFITRLLTIPLRNQVSMLRYLTLIDDMRDSNISITRHEWNQAASLVLRAFRHTTHNEMRVAFEIWAESERARGASTSVDIFNILLDGATRVGSPQLTFSILREMRKRGLRYDRFTYTTLIMYYSSTGEVSKIREVYESLVDDGEVVDNVILNAVMTGLLRAGEEHDATQIYDFMKKAGSMTVTNPSSKLVSWRTARRIAQTLKRMRGVKDYMNHVNASLGPDVATFNLFIDHHCRRARWDRAHRIIEDMKMFDVPLGQSVYLFLLKGFAWHGSSKMIKSWWSREQLATILEIVLDDSIGVIVWDRSMAVWVVRAVTKVYADPNILIKVWEVIENQWEKQASVNEGDGVNEFATMMFSASLQSLRERKSKMNF